MEQIKQSLSREEAKNQRDIIVERMMPQFKEMCGVRDDVEDIILTDAAFGDSPHEMELMGLAIKYACERGFKVTVIPFATEVEIKK